jgi:hypothetical protein
MSMSNRQQREVDVAWISLKKLLELLRKETRGEKEVDEHW